MATIINSVDWVLYLLAFLFSFTLAKSAWIFWRQEIYKSRIDWIMLEIKIPRETTRGPKAMEQVLASIYNLRNYAVGPKEVYLDGEITRWYSLEIVGYNGVTQLFARLPRLLRHPFESSFYAQYPDVEIIETHDDYIYQYPSTYQELKKRGYEIYGLELTQSKDPAYSFDTYVDFEPKVGDEKGRIMDSMSGIIEIIGRCKPDETLWIQFLIQPDTKGGHKDHWFKNADKLIEKMKSATQGGEEEHGTENVGIRLRFRTQAEEKVLERIEDKKGLAVYETLLRVVYIAPKSIYNGDLPNRGVHGYIAQFQNEVQRVKKLDRIRSKVDADAFPFIFPKKRLFWKRVKTYEEYRRRFIPEETFMGKIGNSLPLRFCFWHKPMILSVEELATFFHVPTNVVLTQVSMDRIESKRLSPPSNLPG